MQEATMPIRPNLQLLLAQTNVERAKQGHPPLSLRQLALACDLAPSVLTTLAGGKTRRIDYDTLDKLLTFFNQYFPVTTGDLLHWTPSAAQSEVNHA
jgi:DNA-binding Xre family transcriptional regulator